MSKTTDQKQHKKVKFENFGFIDYKLISIILTNFEQTQYAATIGIHFGDDDDVCAKTLHMEVPIAGEKIDVIQHTVSGIVTLFGTDVVLDNVMILNTDGELLEEFTLEDFAKEIKKQSKQTKQLVKRGN